MGMIGYMDVCITTQVYKGGTKASNSIRGAIHDAISRFIVASSSSALYVTGNFFFLIIISKGGPGPRIYYMKENSCAHHFEWFQKEMFEQPYLSTLFSCGNERKCCCDEFKADDSQSFSSRLLCRI